MPQKAPKALKNKARLDSLTLFHTLQQSVTPCQSSKQLGNGTGDCYLILSGARVPIVARECASFVLVTDGAVIQFS